MKSKDNHFLYNKKYFEERIEEAIRRRGSLTKITVDDLKLSTRTTNVLKRENILMASDMLSLSKGDVLSLQNAGKKTVGEIMTAVKAIASYKPEEVGGGETGIDNNQEWLMNKRISELPLRKRDIKMLHEKGVVTIRDLLQLTEVDGISFGDDTTTIHEIRGFIKELSATEYIPTLTDQSLEISIQAAIKEKGSFSKVTIEDIGLSVRAIRVLEKAGITMLEDLAAMSIEKVRCIKGIGIKTVDEIICAIRVILCYKKLGYGGSTPNADKLINDLPLSVRAKNILQRNGIFTVNKLLQFTNDELISFKGMGKSTYLEIKAFLNQEARDVTENSESNNGLANIVESYVKEFHETKCVYYEVSNQNIWNRVYGILNSTPSPENVTLKQIIEDDFFETLFWNALVAEAKGGFIVTEKTLSTVFGGNLRDFQKEHVAKWLYEDKIEEKKEIYLICYPSIMDYVYSIEDERKRDILLMKLNGLTLEQIGQKYGITKEAARQLIERILKKREKVSEDMFSELFEKYRFTKESFIAVTGEKATTYEYMRITCERGSEKLTEIMREDLPSYILSNAEKYIYGDSIDDNDIKSKQKKQLQ